MQWLWKSRSCNQRGPWRTATVVTGAPAAAAASNSSSVLSNTTSGSPTAGGSTSTPGATTSTSTGANITSADFTITPVAATTAGPKTVNTNTSTSGPLGYPDTLADVAQYYYITDLRAPGSLGAAVGSPAVQLDVGTLITFRDSPAPIRKRQRELAAYDHPHPRTGRGWVADVRFGLSQQPDRDFLAIKNGTMNWPQPVADTVTAVDDLWHAAVNGGARTSVPRTRPSSCPDCRTR